MSRIEECFNSLKDNQRTALIPFLTAGDPSKGLTPELMHELVLAGADLIELGMPFSDPMADGPVIQRASERALQNGINTDDVFDIVCEFRKTDKKTPIILMGYLNPIEIFGYEQFADMSSYTGVDGVLVVDLPPEESEVFNSIFKRHNLDQIFLISPTTEGERLRQICEVGSGFLYYVSLKGVTGSDALDLSTVSAKLDGIRAMTNIPLGVGFGIKDAQTAANVAGICDAVIVGSALVERIACYTGSSEELKSCVNEFVSSLRNALNNT